MNHTVGKIILVLEHKMTNRLIGSGLSDRSSSPNLSVASHVTTSVAESRIALPPGSRTEALRVATHGQPIGTFVGGQRDSSSSSSSCHAISTDLPDPLPPPFSIVHRFRYVFKATSCIGTELLYVGPCWSSCLCSSM